MADNGYLCFGNLPNQVQRKFAKKGFEFNLMVVGESGLGKTTLTNCLFQTNLNVNRPIPSTEELINRTLSIQTNSVDIEDRGVRLKLTIVDTPGYGDALNCSDNYEPILNYIDEQFEKYLMNESGLNRRQIRDTRVHCCFYFISPENCGLKPADIHFLRLLQNKVNIVPLIAKSDFLTPSETMVLKKKIIDEIKHYKIDIYNIPDCEPDDDDDYKEHVNRLKNSMPFAISSSLEIHEVQGRKVRGRLYPWGIVETENPEHSDYIKLRSMLVSQMQDLREVTHDIHYESYRSERLNSVGISDDQQTLTPIKFASEINLNRDNVNVILGNSPMSIIDSESEKDRILQEQEAEIKRMQEMLAKMKEEMRLQQQQLLNNSLESMSIVNGTNGHA